MSDHWARWLPSLALAVALGLLSNPWLPGNGYAPQQPLILTDGVALPGTFCATFNDTSAHDYYCLALQAMYKSNAVAGYSDGTFRPNAKVTRGQFSKMLVHAYGWTLLAPRRATFSDVPPGSPFYKEIETAVSKNIMSGYSNPMCARYGLAAPCFFPNNPIIRGELAKMVSQASGFADSVQGRSPTFADVPNSDPFYVYIERLVMHAVASPFPPTAAPLPFCSSLTQPCYFPHVDTPRADAVLHVYNGQYRSTALFNGFAQVFGYTGNAYSVYDGVWAYMTTPDPNIGQGNNVGAVVGATDIYNGHFVESGSSKKCNILSCIIRPYANWSDSTSERGVVDTNIVLVGGLTYAYKSFYIGGTGGQWKAQFCSTGCTDLITSGDIGTSLPYVSAGGESINLNVSFGSTTVSYPRASINGNWHYWCYDPTAIPWRTLNGSLTPCNPNNAGWTAQY